MTPLFAMAVDPWILAFSAITVGATIFMGFWSAKKSKTASDFFVAGRSVSVGWNASAISGEYLSAASFMGVAGMVMSSGYDALWYPVCYACGYLFLLLFIAGPLRRFGAYTIPDFAEGRYDSPVFRKIAVVFVLFIGFFYTMPQMKGAGTTLAYIFPGLPYWAGVVLVGAVITLNVALGGMKGITLVQAFQYWAKMFAISVPIFVLMAVYGHYGKQLEINASKVADARRASLEASNFLVAYPGPASFLEKAEYQIRSQLNLPRGKPIPPSGKFTSHQYFSREVGLHQLLEDYGKLVEKRILLAKSVQQGEPIPFAYAALSASQFEWAVTNALALAGISLVPDGEHVLKAIPNERFRGPRIGEPRQPPFERFVVPGTSNTLPTFAGSNQTDKTFMPEVDAAKSYLSESSGSLLKEGLSLKPSGEPNRNTGSSNLWANSGLNLRAPITPPRPNNSSTDAEFGQRLKRLSAKPAEAMPSRGVLPDKAPKDETWINPFGPLTTKAAKAANLSAEESKPYSLLYTYSLIIALVCGTAGLPHILVRFYTNPDGVAAKRTTMWVMILIGIFYVFPPVFGVMGRNLLPDLYAGVGAKGTDKIVLELPRILNDRYAPLGSILSGITCAGAFAAFMSTFSGLLVSMTGAMAHDVYGRMLRPKSTPEQRLRAFKVCTVIIGGIAIILGCFVEPLEINFMVGQAFAIAAASYFPLLFMSVWWRGMTMRGAATGMLTGGLCALAAVTLTNVSNLALDKGPMGKVFAGFAPLNPFWATHPLLRILCEQPAIWTVPLAIGLMIVIGKLTSRAVPTDTRMKMLVLHAPEKLGLKQEYIQEHQGH